VLHLHPLDQARYPKGGRRREDEPPGKSGAFAPIPGDDEYQGDEYLESGPRDYWGRAFLGARLEWIGAPKPGVDSPSPANFGPVAASRLETVTWEGWQLRVPPLYLQRAVSQRRGLTGRVALIDAIRSQ